MSLRGRIIADAGGPEWWRGPWLTKEDIRALNSLPPVKAKAFELLLHQQARSDSRYRDHTIPLERFSST
jgi:hypothetical protein